MNIRTFGLHLIFGLLSTGLVTAAHTAHADAIPGKPAPDFSVPAADGKTYSLKDLHGKYVVLEWYNPQCPFVKKHYNTKNMQSLQEKYVAKDVVWLTVDSAAPVRPGYLTTEQAQAAIAEHGIKSTALLLDSEGTMGKAYGAKTTPHMFVINPEGAVIYAGAIDDNDSARESAVEGAKNYVAAALDEAMAGKPVTVASTAAYGCSVKYAD